MTCHEPWPSSTLGLVVVPSVARCGHARRLDRTGCTSDRQAVTNDHPQCIRKSPTRSFARCGFQKSQSQVVKMFIILAYHNQHKGVSSVCRGGPLVAYTGKLCTGSPVLILYHCSIIRLSRGCSSLESSSRLLSSSLARRVCCLETCWQVDGVLGWC